MVVNMNRGGAETLIMNLYQNIDRSKIQFDFLTCKKGVFDEKIIELGGKIHRIPYVTDVGHFGYLKEIRSFFQSYSNYQIVHSHLDKMSGLVLRSAKKVGIPVRIAHSHNTSSEGGMAAKLYKTYAGKFILPNATHLVACSKHAARWLFDSKAEKAMLIRNGIDYEAFAFSKEIRKKVREELNLSEDTFVVGHVGRFSLQKNHSFLLDIFEALLKRKPNAILLLAGDGPLRKKIESKVKRLNISDRVLFLGIRSDINRLLQAFDVFVFPSFHEGLPVTLIEAQGSGLPCVISDAISEEVDLGAGLIRFESINNSPNAWVEQVLSRNNRMIDARDWIKHNGYDIQKSAQLLEEMYPQILGAYIQKPKNSFTKKEYSHYV